MPSRFLLCSLAVAASTLGLACSSPAATSRPAAAALTPATLRLIDQVQLDPRLSELTFTTPALDAPVKVRVLVPRDAAAHPDVRYPVLYLLHGADGNVTTWTDLRAEQLTEDLGVVVVMPDGGGGGWYTDWPDGSRPQWEQFHINQLIPWIDAHEPAIGARTQRAIAGGSMGGFGAMSYAARHPGLFAAAASFSGALDLGTPPGNEQRVVGQQPWGPWDGPQVAWRGHNPADLAGNLRGVDLAMYTGNGQPGGPLDDGQPDPDEALLGQQGDAFAARLDALGVPHFYDNYGPGAHNGVYSVRDLQQWLPRLMDRFAHPADPPSPFDFTATEATFAVRGYTVQAARGVLAFRTLRRVGTAGFTLSTDGATTVTTARRYARRARYRVRIQRGSRVRTTVLRSTSDGRLAIAVPGSASVGITRAAAAS